MGYRDRYNTEEKKINAKTYEVPQAPGKTENFFSRNVRLITFVICISVFLVIFIPIAGLEAIDYFSKLGETRPEMTLEDAIYLSDRDGIITESDLKKYAGETERSQEYTYYYIDIGDAYEVVAWVDRDTGRAVYCQLVDYEGDRSANLLKDDIRAFLGRN